MHILISNCCATYALYNQPACKAQRLIKHMYAYGVWNAVAYEEQAMKLGLSAPQREIQQLHGMCGT